MYIPRWKKCIYLYSDSGGEVFSVTNHRYFNVGLSRGPCHSRLSHWSPAHRPLSLPVPSGAVGHFTDSDRHCLQTQCPHKLQLDCPVSVSCTATGLGQHFSGRLTSDEWLTGDTHCSHSQSHSVTLTL